MSPKRRTLVLALVVGLHCLAVERVWAQSGSVEGRVVVESTSAGVAGAEVRLIEAGLRAVTSASGGFSLRGVPVGEHTLDVRLLGYGGVQRGIHVAADELVRVTVPVEPEAVSVQAVTVTVPRTRAATKTNEAVSRIPQAVVVVPESVLEEQQVEELADVLRNVSSAVHTGSFQGVSADFHMRGFLIGRLGNYRRNGVEVFGLSDVMDANVEAVEVLKGPSSVLYGSVEPGGLVNVVTKRPLAQRVRRAGVRVGSYGLVSPRVDLTGPLDRDGSLLYRLNASYERAGSFRDRVESDALFVSPVLTWRPTARTEWTIEAGLKQEDRVTDPGIAGLSDDWSGVDAAPLRA